MRLIELGCSVQHKKLYCNNYVTCKTQLLDQFIVVCVSTYDWLGRDKIRKSFPVSWLYINIFESDCV